MILVKRRGGHTYGTTILNYTNVANMGTRLSMLFLDKRWIWKSIYSSLQNVSHLNNLLLLVSAKHRILLILLESKIASPLPETTETSSSTPSSPSTEMFDAHAKAVARRFSLNMQYTAGEVVRYVTDKGQNVYVVCAKTHTATTMTKPVSTALFTTPPIVVLTNFS